MVHVIDAILIPPVWINFAPTNEAFKALPATLLSCLLSPFGVTTLQSLIEYHAVTESFYCGAQAAFWGHALLDCWELSPGQAWWFHRTEPNLSFDLDVPRRNWLQGRIAQIDGSGFHALLRRGLSL